MNPPISEAKKKAIINSAQATYTGYLLLDLCTNNYYANRKKAFRINQGTGSFKDFIVNKINAAGMQQEVDERFKLNGKEYTLKLRRKENGDWSVAIGGDPGIEAVGLKPLNQCTPEEFVKLTQQHSLTLTKDNSGGYKFSTEITANGKTVTLGGKNSAGKGKIELYQLHINNLYAVLKNFSAAEPNLHMLIAMATGSGKSYTQALWFLIMYMADYSCIFTTPRDDLVVQLREDFGRLLPDEIMPYIQGDTPPDSKKAPFYSITTYQKLLMNDWGKIYNAKHPDPHQDLFLSFDEEHDAATVELYKKRIQLLTKQHGALFLSATPSKLSYKICGEKSLVSLSKKDQEKLGISKSADSTTIQAKAAAMRGKTLLERGILTFVDAIETHRVSPVHTYLDSSETAVIFRKETDPFHVKPDSLTTKDAKALYHLMRWNTHCPIAEKALVLLTKHDYVVNFSTAIHQKEKYAYKGGNRVSRANVYEFFQLGDNLDEKKFEEERAARKDLRRQHFAYYIKDQNKNYDAAAINHFITEQIDLRETSDFLIYRMYHGIIENTLEFLTGFDSARLDHERFHNLDDLNKLVQEKIKNLKKGDEALLTLITAKLQSDKIPPELALHIAGLMVKVIDELDTPSAGPDMSLAMIDNWHLNKKLHDHCDQLFKKDSFFEQYKTVFLMKGLKQTATPVEDNKPFFKLKETAEILRDYKPAKKAPLKHKLSTLEALDDTTSQYVYTPEYCPDEVTPAVIDTLFRKGLIGAYVSSERATGFNDPNLHHVSLLLDTHDELNKPDQIIQGSGRNRGLNPAQQPYFSLIQDENVTATFSPNLLEKGNYFPDLFSARKSAHKAMVKRLGLRMAAEIQKFIETATDHYGEVDPIELQNKCRAIMLHEFDKIYKANNHNYEKSKQEFAKVLNDTYRALYQGAKALNRNYELRFSAKVIAFILNLISSIWYYSVTRTSAKEFKKACKELIPSSKDLLPELTYGHIVQNYQFRDVVKHVIGMKRMAEAMKEDTKKAEKYIADNPISFFNGNLKKPLNDYFKTVIAPIMVHLFGDFNQQAALLALIQQHPDWTTHFLKHGLGKLEDSPEELLSEFVDMMQEIPSIKTYLDNEHITASDKVYEDSRQFAANTSAKIEHLSPKEISQLLKDNLNHIMIRLDPRQAQFFMQHKEQLHLSIDLWTELTEGEATPQAIEIILTKALPETLRNQVPAVMTDDEKDQKEKELLAVLADLQGDTGKYIDSDKLRAVFAKTLSRYVESKPYKEIFAKIINPLRTEHLETILKSLYPNDGDNSTKVELIIEYNKDLTEKMSGTDLLNKYGEFEQEGFKSSNFHKIHTWLQDIYKEVLDSVCYYQSMTDKGQSTWNKKSLVKPQLKVYSKHPDHKVWTLHALETPSGITSIAQKTSFINGSLKAFGFLNKIEGVQNKPIQNQLERTAENVILPTFRAIKNKQTTINKLKTPQEQQSVQLSTSFGAFFAKGDSLTQEEVQSPDTKTPSAVEKLKEQLTPTKK